MHQHNYDNTPNVQAVPTGAMKTEPVISVGSITAAVTAVIALLVAYGFDISGDQQTAILGIVAVLAPMIAMAFTRGKVYSPASAQKAANEAAVTQDATIAPPPAK